MEQHLSLKWSPIQSPQNLIPWTKSNTQDLVKSVLQRPTPTLQEKELSAPQLPSNPHLQVIFPVHSQPVTKHVSGNHHVGFHSIHGEPVHAKELGQEGVPMTLHYELEESGEGEGTERQCCHTKPISDRTQAQQEGDSKASCSSHLIPMWKARKLANSS